MEPVVNTIEPVGIAVAPMMESDSAECWVYVFQCFLRVTRRRPSPQSPRSERPDDPHGSSVRPSVPIRFVRWFTGFSFLPSSTQTSVSCLHLHTSQLSLLPYIIIHLRTVGADNHVK